MLTRDMSNYDRLQMSMTCITQDLKHTGRVTAVLVVHMHDSIAKPVAFLARALALNNNLLFCGERIQLAVRALMHVDMHNTYPTPLAQALPCLST